MRLVIFTDLDGTLLDHDTYSYSPAQPALVALKEHDIPLILASSKTAAEIAPLHADLGLGALPAIVENGAARMVPGQPDPSGTHDRLRAALDALPPALRSQFKGFTDMTVQEVADVTGLPLNKAALARTRAFTEPGLWSGSDDDLDRFRAELNAQGIAARHGGRFLTLTFGGTKAQQMAEIARDLDATQTLALGDAPNDSEMLEAATRGVIIRNDHGTPLPRLSGEAEGRIIRTDLPGPEGWNKAVLSALDALGI